VATTGRGAPGTRDTAERCHEESVDHAVLMGLFAHRLRDARTLTLIERLLAAGRSVYRHPLARRIFAADELRPGRGLPLGGYLSHWCGGFYLDGLDHFVKRRLGVRGYLRYMDDFVLFDDEPDRLLAWRDAIATWLWDARRLALKDPAAGVHPRHCPARFLGFKITRGRIAPGAKGIRRFRARMRRLDGETPEGLERRLRATLGGWTVLH